MPSTSVEGRILDMFGRPLAAVQVKLSGVDPVVTDSSGNFSAADVPATYDAEFRFTKRSGYYQRTYRFLGLSRRDPTFEVADDIGEQEGRVDLTVSNLPAPMVGDLSASVGNPIDTPFFGDETGLSSAVSLDYDGSDPFATEVHALFWEDAGISSDFFGIASRTLAMNDGEVTDVILDSWTTIATTGVLSGHLVAPSATGDVEVTAFLNFSDGASIPLQTVVWNSANESFSLTVPDVDSATFSVLACFHDDGFGCAHADGFTIGQAATSIDLSIPRRPLLQSPAHEAVGVDGDTVLSWEPSDASPCSVVFLNNAGWLRGLRIVTCEPEVTLGAEILETYFSPGETLYYTVQSFGTAEDPDDLAGPNGLLDPYYDGKHSLTYPRGKNRPVTGILSRAEPYSFVVAY
jgi:hypothetical protein